MAWRLILPRDHTYLWWELVVRMVLISGFIATEKISPFWRIIQPAEEWMYSFPQTPSYITTDLAYGLCISAVLLTVLVFYAFTRNLLEALVALLVPSLALPLNGLVTNAFKLTVGRPRPDYFDRCYPGVKDFNSSLPCTGLMKELIEGRKSFPSGHSSMFFCSCTFIALFLAAQLGVFNKRGKGQTWRLLLFILPLLAAALVAVSRTADYHHHWQDVTVGSILGAFISYVIYRQYYPSLGSDKAHKAYFALEDGYSWNQPSETKGSSSQRRSYASTSPASYNEIKSV